MTFNYKIANYLFLVGVLFLLSCQSEQDETVGSLDELKAAIDNAQPGDEIVTVNGTDENAEVLFTGNGTKEKPIISHMNQRIL